MAGKFSQDWMRRKIERLEKELKEKEQDNIALSNENKSLRSKYYEASKRADALEQELNGRAEAYDDAFRKMSQAKNKYETMVAELRSMQMNYKKEVEAMIASLSKRVSN